MSAMYFDDDHQMPEFIAWAKEFLGLNEDQLKWRASQLNERRGSIVNGEPHYVIGEKGTPDPCLRIIKPFDVPVYRVDKRDKLTQQPILNKDGSVAYTYRLSTRNPELLPAKWLIKSYVKKS
jgi:hypothetical protein